RFERVTPGQFRLPAFFGATDKIRDRSFDVSRTVDAVFTAIDRFPIFIAIPPDAKDRHVFTGGTDLDDPVGTDHTVVAADKIPALTGRRDAVDAVVVLPQGKGLVFVVRTKYEGLFPIINL